MSKYALLIYAPAEGGPSADERAGRVPLWRAYNQTLIDAGVVLASQELDGVEAATTVRERDRKIQIIDSPAATSEEFLAGYYILECRDLDDALACARAVPLADYGSVEVRPVLPSSESLAPEVPQAARA